MSTQTLVRAGSLPVVNLLPPEIGEQRRLRRLQTGLGAGVVASVGLVALLFAGAASQASNAASDLEATQAEGSSLTAETAKYADVPAVIAKVDAAMLQRAHAMSQEIRWSVFLNDLSLRIPSKVWLTGVTAAQADAGAAAATAPTTVPGAATYPEPGVGTVTFEGKAYRHNDVAAWLQMLAKEPGWTQPYFTNSSEDESLTNPNGDPAVTFSSTVTVTEEALSRRFEQKAGS